MHCCTGEVMGCSYAHSFASRCSVWPVLWNPIKPALPPSLYLSCAAGYNGPIRRSQVFGDRSLAEHEVVGELAAQLAASGDSGAP